MRRIAGTMAIWLAVVIPGELLAQARDAPVHCCTVVRVDLKGRIVTARETSTGYTFRVEVRNRKHIVALKVGDKIWADFAARQVRLEAAGDSLCCPILDTLEQGKSPAEATPHEEGTHLPSHRRS